MKNREIVLRAKRISKSFGKVQANDQIDLELQKGTIMAILGENGSGKTTLIHILAGIYSPDSGIIEVNGVRKNIRSPREAGRLGIGIVHQHCELVKCMTAAENIAMGLEDRSYKDLEEINCRIQEISNTYGLYIDLNKKVYEMSIAEKQTVEILKALLKKAEILILDEPTAVLTPEETESLFAVLRFMKQKGKSIILITHKLKEVMEISDEVFIMRKGRWVTTVKTKETSAEKLAQHMMGYKVEATWKHPKGKRGEMLLSVASLTYENEMGIEVLKNVSFDLYEGEILGIAGVAGSGQKELCEILAGILTFKSGQIYKRKEKITVGFIPEDRLGMGMLASGDLVDNLLLRGYKKNKGFFMKRQQVQNQADHLKATMQIDMPDPRAAVRTLSGGNIQKIILGREIARQPQLLIAAYPMRGLDLKSCHLVYDMLCEEKRKGTCVVFVGEDLDTLMELSDRILVLADHTVSGIVNPQRISRREIGTLMMRASEGGICA